LTIFRTVFSEGSLLEILCVSNASYAMNKYSPYMPGGPGSTSAGRPNQAGPLSATAAEEEPDIVATQSWNNSGKAATGDTEPEQL
jgi:hypothetical protein